MSTTYTISQDRKTITVNLGAPIPGTSADDHCVHINIEEAAGVISARYVSPDVVGVIRATMAGMTPQPANIEQLIFGVIVSTFTGNIAQHYPASVASALTNQTAAQAAVSSAINAIVAEQVLL